MIGKQIFLAFVLVTASIKAEDAIDLQRLLGEIVDRSRIAEFPQPEFICRQASSYNRKSETPGNPNWFAGADFDQFYGSRLLEGRREWIMLEVDGPGVVTRWWQTQCRSAGTIRVYLGRASEPIFQGTGAQLLGEGAIVGPPLAANRKIDYATTTHWYAFDGASDNGHNALGRVREKVAQPWAGPDEIPTPKP